MPKITKELTERVNYGLDQKLGVEKMEKLFGKPVIRNVKKFGAKFDVTGMSNDGYDR